MCCIHFNKKKYPKASTLLTFTLCDIFAVFMLIQNISWHVDDQLFTLTLLCFFSVTESPVFESKARRRRSPSSSIPQTPSPPFRQSCPCPSRCSTIAPWTCQRRRSLTCLRRWWWVFVYLLWRFKIQTTPSPRHYDLDTLFDRFILLTVASHVTGVS